MEDETSVLIPSEQESTEWVFPVQRFVDFNGEEFIICNPRIPALGYITLIPAGYTHEARSFMFRGDSIKTPFYEIRFDKAGRITSLVDVGQELELVASGGLFNSFITAQDIPLQYEAWDIDADWELFQKEETELLSTEISASGPLCFKIRRKYKIGEASTLVQDMTFYSNNRRIDFDTQVDWKEKQKLLKVVFDTFIDASQVRCDVQYGHIFRNAHQNLPQDRAKFEFCAHKWVSVEQDDYVIALLNDCKYGYHARGGSLGLTLLRSPLAPDPEADQGLHRFNYAILPYNSDFRDSRIIQSGYEFNSPSIARPLPLPMGRMGMIIWEHSLLNVDGDQVIVEAVKFAEDWDANEEQTYPPIIIRIYECYGGNAHMNLDFFGYPDIRSVSEVDMLEKNPQPLHHEDHNFNLEFKPFEIKTIMVQFED